jgi:hypothetical protein
VLHKGRSSGVVPVEEACKLYDHYNMLERMQQPLPPESRKDLPSEYGGLRGGTGDAVIEKVEVLDENLKSVSSLPYGKTFVLRCYLSVRARLSDAIVRMQVDAEINKAIVILDSYEAHGRVFDFVPGNGHVDIEVRNPRLRPGTYDFSGSLLSKRAGVHVFFEYNQARLMITHPSDNFFYADFRSSYQPDVEYRGSFAFAAAPSAPIPAEEGTATHE